MVKFNGMPQSYAMRGLDEVPLVNSVYGCVRLLDIKGEKPKYIVEYETDKFSKYGFSTTSKKDAMKYMFCIQTMHPFHSFIYNSGTLFKMYDSLPNDFRAFMQYLSGKYSPVSVIPMPALGIKEVYGIWEGEVNVYVESGVKYRRAFIDSDIHKFIKNIGTYDDYWPTAVFDIPWYMEKLCPDVVPYMYSIPVLLSRYHDIESGSYKGTVMWTDGVSFFREDIIEYDEYSYKRSMNDIISDIRNVYKGRMVRKHIRKHTGVLDGYVSKDFVMQWTGYNVNLNDIIGDDRLYK